MKEAENAVIVRQVKMETFTTSTRELRKQIRAAIKQEAANLKIAGVIQTMLRRSVCVLICYKTSDSGNAQMFVDLLFDPTHCKIFQAQGIMQATFTHDEATSRMTRFGLNLDSTFEERDSPDSISDCSSNDGL